MLRLEDARKFYQTSESIGINDLLDLLLKRYSNIEYVMSMEASEGFALIMCAFENNQKEQMFQKWLHDDARYEKSFEEYYSMAKPYRKSTDAEKDEIINKYGG